jgi:hypothetical protein
MTWRAYSGCVADPVCFALAMSNDPQTDADALADGELSDEALGSVIGGAVIGCPIAD